MRILVVVCALISWALPASAQQSIQFGSIGGRVTDPSGGLVVNADVVAVHLETQVATTTSTDGEGRFRFPYLKVGTYEVAVHAPGFEPVTRRLVVSVASAHEIPLALPVGGLTAAVDVRADDEVLEAARSQIAATLPERELRAVPLNGRHVLDLALLVPGVSPTNTNSTQLFPETSAVPGTTLSVSSQRNLSNNFVVDGLSANDDAAALSGIVFGADAIEQVQVVTSGAQAELGRALGGYVNLVTRSGTNDMHGTAYGFFKDDRLAARPPLATTRLPMRQTQAGGSLGGPLVRARTFYFVNAETRRLDQMGLTTIPAETVETINARLVETGYRGPLVQTGPYANPIDTTLLFGRVDHQWSPSHQLAVRYNLYDASAEHVRGAGGLSAPSAASGLENVDQAVALNSIWMVSPRTVLETRAQFSSADLEAPPADPIGPAVSIAGVASFGRLSTSPTARTNRLVQIVQNVSHQAGAHALRAGVDFQHNADRITFPRASGGTYTFASLSQFLAGQYNTAGFTQTFGATEIEQGNSNWGVYIQDEWKAHPRLTLNLGLRHDLQYLETITTDTDNLSPRVGLAWTPFDSRRTVVRAGGGLFYDRVPLRALANALLSAGNTTDVSRLRQIAISLSPGQAGAPAFPAILSAPVPAVTLPNLTTMDPNLQNAHTRQAGVEIEHQLGSKTTVGVGYQYARGEDLLMSINQNVPTCPATGTNNGCRPHAEYANNSQYSAAGSSRYHGLHASVVRRVGGWGHYRVSYTLSKAENDVGEFFFSGPMDPFDLSQDWGRSDNDQRHRLVVSGAARTRDWELGGLLQAYSAPPFNITSGVTTVWGTAGRPVADGSFIPRNAGEGSAFLSLNLRLMRKVALGGGATLEGALEAFNVTNRVNVLTRNTTFGTGAYPASPAPSFGRITGAGEPRTLQLSARVRF